MTEPLDATVSAPGARRLHPYSLIFRFFGAVNNFFIPALLVWWLADEDHQWELWLAALFVPVFLMHLLHYLTLRYVFEDEELVVRKGLIFRSERHLPYARMENVDLVRNPVHRFLDVAVVRIDTASGDEAEAEFRVLSMGAVADLLREIGTRAAGNVGGARAERRLRELESERAGAVSERTEEDEASTGSEHDSVVARLGARELIRLGLISNRGVVALAAITGLAWRFELPEKLLRDSRLEAWIDQLVGSAGFATAVLLGVAALATIMLFSIAWTFFRYHGYRLERADNLFRWSGGAWTHVSASIPSRRIQKLVVRQSILHRVFGRASIRIETAGGREDDDNQAGRADFVPICRAFDVDAILGEVLPHIVRPAADEYEPLHPSTKRRLARGVLYTSPIVFGISIWLLGPIWGSSIAGVYSVVRLCVSFGRARWSGFATRDLAVFHRSGWLARKWTLVPTEKIQVVALDQSPFDRRWDMSSLRVDNAGARTRDPFAIHYVDASRAAQLFRGWSERAARAEFTW